MQGSINHIVHATDLERVQRSNYEFLFATQQK
jgi:hypothetical protein